MSTQNPLNAVRGGAPCTVQFSVTGAMEDVFVREATVREILSGRYMELLLSDPQALLEWLLDKPANWCEGLTRESWQRLREVEEQVNFSFALDEYAAADRRGQKLKPIKDRKTQDQKEMLSMILTALSALSPGASPATASSPEPGRLRPKT